MVCNLLNCEKAGGAEAVCYAGGGGDGVAGCENCGACHVPLAWGENVAETDIFNEGGVEVGFFADNLLLLIGVKR